MGTRILSDAEIARMPGIAPDVPPGGIVIADASYYTASPSGVWEPIDRVWTDIDDPKFDQPQPVNLTPGALGVRCEE